MHGPGTTARIGMSRQDGGVQPVVREASPADAAALVRLRVAMFAAMGRDVGAEDAPWRSAAEHWFAQHLGRDAVAPVVDGPGEGPVAAALAVLRPRAPGPGSGPPSRPPTRWPFACWVWGWCR